MKIRSPITWVVLGGFAAGALDLVFACGYWAIANGVPAERILQSIASGVLGQASYQGGTGSAFLGFMLEFVMTLAMAVAYYLASGKFDVLWRRPISMGIAYGLILFVVMNFVVVPLSNAVVQGVGNDLWTWASVAAHIFVVAIPISLSTRKARLLP